MPAGQPSPAPSACSRVNVCAGGQYALVPGPIHLGYKLVPPGGPPVVLDQVCRIVPSEALRSRSDVPLVLHTGSLNVSSIDGE